MATVATRREKKLVEQEHKRIHLTPTGLLMEGDYTQNPPGRVNECNWGFSPIDISRSGFGTSWLCLPNFDSRLTAQDLFSARFFFSKAPEFWGLGGATFGNGSSLPGFGTEREINNRLLSFQEVHNFSSTGVNEARFGYNFISTNEDPQESLYYPAL